MSTPPSSPSLPPAVRRHLLGAIGLVFMFGWAWMMFLGGGEGSQVLAASCLRIGLVLLAIWLALPQLMTLRLPLPPWLLAGIVLGLLMIAIRPRAAVWVLPLFAAIAALQFIGWLFKPPR